MLGARWRALAVLLVLVATAPRGANGEPAKASLRLVASTALAKTSGRVDQVVPVPGGGWLVRDADFWQEATQAVELYDAQGRKVRKIGQFGRGPGSYFRLKEIALASDGTLWVVDLTGRLSFFGLDGKLQDTLLVQKPGFQLDGLVLDEANQLFYLSGCLPVAGYVEGGCQLLHRYRLADRSFLSSAFTTDPEVLEKNLQDLMEALVAIDGRGRIYVADAPVLRLSVREAEGQPPRAVAIPSKALPRPERLASPVEAKEHYLRSPRIDRLVPLGGRVVVSLFEPLSGSYWLAAFDGAQALATDIKAPGQLVGHDGEHQLLFAIPGGGGYRVHSYELDLPAPPRPGAPARP